MTATKFACIVALFVALLCAGGLFAQGTTADIVGTVFDNTKSVVPNATVTIKNVETGLTRTGSTNQTGSYSFTLLPIGTYSVAIELQGFKKFTTSGVTLSAGDRARVDAEMVLGEMSQSIEVAASGAGTLQTDSATMSTMVTNQAVSDLPMNGRNFVQLVQLAPGVNEGSLSSLSGGNRPDDRRQTSSMAANGQNDSQNNFMLDGMDNNERNMGTMIVKPSADAIAEVRVQTNMYGPEVGRTGGAVVSMMTKSGTNNIHGSAFEFLRNDILDAKNFFNVQTAGNPWAGAKPEFRRNQFGGSVGAPIRKDKTFVFGDYEGLRIVQGVLGQQAVPTACQLGKAACNGITQLGNLSAATSTIYDMTQSIPAPFPNNVIPLSRISSLVKNYAALYPNVTGSSCTGNSCNFVNSPLRTQVADTFDTRVDQNFSTKNTLFGRYSFNNTNTFTPGLLPQVNVAGVDVSPGGNSGGVGLGVDGFPGTSHQRSQNGSVTYAHVFSPTLLLQLRAGVTRYVSSATGLNYGKDVNVAFGGPASVNISPSSSGLALIGITGYAGVGDAFFTPTEYWTTSYQTNGDLTWTKGAHDLKFGGSLIRRLWNQNQSSYARGNFSFGPQMTNSAAGGAGGTGGNAFASFILGYPNSWQRAYAMVQPQYRAWDVGSYVQDNWRISRRLTVNLGLRWDIYTRFVEKHDHISSFDPTVASELQGGQVLVAGQNGVSRSVNIPTEYTDFQPRLGFAYTAGRGFVVRGGFGTSFVPSGLGSPANMKSFPFIANNVINNALGARGSAPAFQFGTAYPTLAAVSTCLVAACGATNPGISVPSNTGTDVRNSWSYQFNVTAEKAFAGNVLTVSYVGNRGHNLMRSANENLGLPPLGPGGCGVTTTQNLPNKCQPYYAQLPLVSTITVLRSNGKSNYNSLQTVFSRPLSKGLNLSTNYTYARALANVAGPEASFAGQNVVPQWYSWYDYGNSYFDVRHRVALTANYSLPFGKSLKGVARHVVEGWQLNLIALYSTGLPFTVTNTSNAQQNSGATTTDRPSALPKSSGFTPTIGQWIDTSAFVLQPFGTAGTEGANMFYGPDQKRIDFSVFKNFRVTEAIKLQFRAESYNLTNSPSFNQPTATIAGWGSNGRPTQTGNFGVITSTSPFYTPRDIQFALKFLF